VERKSLTGLESRIGGVEAAVLDGGGGVIANEGPGLGEAERTVMAVGGESWTRSGRVGETRSRHGRP